MRARKQGIQETNPEGQGCNNHREKLVQIKEGGGRPLSDSYPIMRVESIRTHDVMES